jgi:hypothetical protein
MNYSFKEFTKKTAIVEKFLTNLLSMALPAHNLVLSLTKDIFFEA